MGLPILAEAEGRSEQKNSTGVAEEARFLVVAETKIRGLGDRVDGLRGTGKKMPAAFGERAGKAGHRFVLFLQRRVRGVRGVKADEDNLIIGARIEGNHLESADDGLLDLAGERGGRE